jgi:hypothetical protein
MPVKSMIVFALALGLAHAPALAAPTPSADSVSPTEFSAQRRYRPVSTRIEVYPKTPLVRRCVDWYAIEHRPSGTVLTPHMRCWWARH